VRGFASVPIDGGQLTTFALAATISLGLLLPATSSSLPACIVRTELERTLFGLARGGVCLAEAVTSLAVGSYPTISPLLVCPPRRDGLPAVSFLWHFPSRGVLTFISRSRGWALPTTVSCRARTFLRRGFPRPRLPGHTINYTSPSASERKRKLSTFTTPGIGERSYVAGIETALLRLRSGDVVNTFKLCANHVLSFFFLWPLC
jgi:hypothetical protein